MLAGPFANFLLGIVIFAGITLATGIVYQEARITCVEPGTPAAKAGLEAGDRIVSVAGKPVKSFEDFSMSVKLNARSPINIGVDRGGKQLDFVATPELTEGECMGRLGVVGGNKRDDAKVVSAGMIQALGLWGSADVANHQRGRFNFSIN